MSRLLLQHQQLPAEGAGTMTFLFRTVKHSAAVSAASNLERDPVTSQLEVIDSKLPILIQESRFLRDELNVVFRSVRQIVSFCQQLEKAFFF